MKTYIVEHGEISVQGSDSDDILKQKAEKHLPDALAQLGRKASEEAWATLERGLRNSPFKMENSPSEKSKFLKESTAEFVRSASESDKRAIIQSIFEQLREFRDRRS